MSANAAAAANARRRITRDCMVVSEGGYFAR
jgi:hypothetical protein